MCDFARNASGQSLGLLPTPRASTVVQASDFSTSSKGAEQKRSIHPAGLLAASCERLPAGAAGAEARAGATLVVERGRSKLSSKIVSP